MSNKTHDREWESVFVSELAEVMWLLSEKENGMPLPISGGILRQGRTEQQAKDIYSLSNELSTCIRQKKYNRVKKIKDTAFSQHAVILYNESSNRGGVHVTAVDLSRIPSDERNQIRESIESCFRDLAKSDGQHAFSANLAEWHAIQSAANIYKIDESAFVLQASKGIADFVVESALSGESISLDDTFSLLHRLLSLRDTKLFTADEIRKLGLTGEQGEIFGKMQEQKQAGLRGVKNTVSGGEQTA